MGVVARETVVDLVAVEKLTLLDTLRVPTRTGLRQRFLFVSPLSLS